MSIKNREYYMGISAFKKPIITTEKEAIGARLLQLITMEPGDDPLHPDMGVGIDTYRYGLDNLESLRSRIEDQINTYLPIYQGANITLIRTPDKLINIEIVLGDIKFIYDSEYSSKPIILSDLSDTTT